MINGTFYWNIRTIATWLWVVFPVLGWTQLTITNGLTPTQLVNGVLVPSGSGTVISNVTFSGVYNQSSRYQVGSFSTGGTTATQMGMSSGVLITSGNTSEIPLTPGVNPRASQLSRNYVSCTTGEVRKGGTCPTVLNDLNILASNQNYFNTAILEFDFVPVLGSVSFRYIFGSEEYEDNSGLINYQCSDYSDRFGFLLSGPGISGGQGYTNDAKNIARLSNGSIVSINSVNNGVVGSSGGAPSASKCLAANAAWVNGSPTTDYLGIIDGTQMNGNTRILTAYQNGLTPGQTYHIKLIIMDVSDGAYDSVVYLEANSFTTETTSLPVELTGFTANCEDRKGVQLNWNTETERLNDYFLVYRASESNPEFELVDTVQGHGSTTAQNHYALLDKQADIGFNYYRLTQVDFDGRQTIVETTVVDASCAIENPNEFEVYLNPETNEFTLFYNIRHSKTVQVGVINLLGQVIEQTNVELQPEEHVVKIPSTHSLATGSYLIRITAGTEQFTAKILK